jgi:hypothetical protein
MMSAQLSQKQMNPAVRIKYEQRNPKKAKSGIRYEGYKRAQTLEEMIALGGTKADFRWDLKRGFVKIIDDSAKLSFESVPAKKTMTQDKIDMLKIKSTTFMWVAGNYTFKAKEDHVDILFSSSSRRFSYIRRKDAKTMTQDKKDKLKRVTFHWGANNYTFKSNKDHVSIGMFLKVKGIFV